MKKANNKRREIIENIVYEYLKNNNYIIVEKNFEHKKEIVDFIVYDDLTKELVFIILKMCLLPKEFNKKEVIEKQDIFDKIAKYYNYAYGLYDIPVRFDMVKVFLSNSIYKIKHIKRIFK